TPPVSVRGMKEKAGYTSYFVAIVALQSAGPIQPGEICSLAEGTPADGLILMIGNEAAHGSIFDHRVQPFLRRWTLEALPFFSRLDPPPHAPTAAAGPFLSKKLFQVCPQAGSHLFDLNLHLASVALPARPDSLR